MTTELIAPQIKQHFEKADGTPLSGGFLFCYSAGTTSKVTTFTDSTGSAANLNPIVLNSRGECDLWLAPGSSYKFVLSPSTDTDPPTSAIYTVDSVTGGVATPVAVASGGTGATTAAAAAAALAVLPTAGGTMTGALVMSGAAVNEAQVSITSAATVNIGAAAANYLNVTGTVTITAFDTVQAGTERTLEFAGALTLTHNGTSLILPGGRNIVTVAGDTIKFRSEGSGNWRAVTLPSRIATKAIMQTGTDDVAEVTPARVNDHDGVAKAWVNFDGAGPTVNVSFNVTSVTKNGTGDYTVNFTTAFASTNYAAVGSGVWGNNGLLSISTRTTGSVRITASLASSPGTLADFAGIALACFGRQ